MYFWRKARVGIPAIGVAAAVDGWSLSAESPGLFGGFEGGRRPQNGSLGPADDRLRSGCRARVPSRRRPPSLVDGGPQRRRGAAENGSEVGGEEVSEEEALMI